MKRAVLALIGVAVIFINWLSLPPASANSPPPPPMVWFTFSHESSRYALQGLQVVKCDTTACQRPVLLIQYGECRTSGCLSGTSTLKQESDHLDCVGDRCLWVMELEHYMPVPGKPSQEALNPDDWFRVIGQFSDRLRLSNVVQITEIAAFTNQKWLVAVNDASLTLTPNHLPFGSDALTQGRSRLFGLSLVLTIPVELAIALAYLRWRKMPWLVIRRTLAAIAVVHLVSFPVVWGFFPSLEPFQAIMTRAFGIGCFVIAAVYAVLMSMGRTMSTRRLIISSVLIIPFLFLINFVVAILIGYGKIVPIAAGLPYGFTLVASEGFAVLYEGWFIAMMSRGKLSLKQAGLMSLLCNAASLIAGITMIFPLSRLE